MRGQLLISLLPAAVLGAPAPEPTTPPSALELRAALDARGFLEARAATGPLAEWVSVISDGYANTYTPSVNVDAGKTTTLNPAPTSLLGVANPTAQDASGRGTFLVCNNKEGVGAPFCTPKNGSEVVAGKTYYCE